NFYGNGKQYILTASGGEDYGDTGPGWHIYSVKSDASDMVRTDIPFTATGLLAITKPDFGEAAVAAGGPNNDPLSPNPIMVGDFDGDGSDDFAFFDSSNASTTTIPAYTG